MQRRRTRLTLFLSVALALSLGTALAAPGTPTPKPPPPPAPPAKAPYPQPNLRDMTKTWGVRVEALRLTANGSMLDFRYRVTDAKKAAPLFEKENKPYLVDEKTGARMFVPAPPKIGALRNTKPPIENRVYFILFADAGKRIRKGDVVTVVIGDFKAEKLKVE